MPRLRPVPFALALTAFDAVWAWQALSAVPRYESSTVSMASLIVWVVFHLPAAVLASLGLKAAGALDAGAAGLPGWSLALMAALGLLQTWALSYGALAWWQGRPRA